MSADDDDDSGMDSEITALMVVLVVLIIVKWWFRCNRWAARAERSQRSSQQGRREPLLRQVSKSATFAAGSIGMEVAVLPANLMALQVIKVTSGSQAQQQGVQVGDVVTGIAGQPLPRGTSHSHFIQLLSAQPRPVVLNFNGLSVPPQSTQPPPLALPLLPAGWFAQRDPATGREFYVNKTSGTTQWAFPQAS